MFRYGNFSCFTVEVSKSPNRVRERIPRCILLAFCHVVAITVRSLPVHYTSTSHGTREMILKTEGKATAGRRGLASRGAFRKCPSHFFPVKVNRIAVVFRGVKSFVCTPDIVSGIVACWNPVSFVFSGATTFFFVLHDRFQSREVSKRCSVWNSSACAFVGELLLVPFYLPSIAGTVFPTLYDG